MSIGLPAALEVAALMRPVAAAGGFAMVLAKGEPDAGAILVVIMTNGTGARVYERMPQADGDRIWQIARREDPQDPQDLPDYLDRRHAQDPDLWVIELDIADGERFIGIAPPED